MLAPIRRKEKNKCELVAKFICTLHNMNDRRTEIEITKCIPLKYELFRIFIIHTTRILKWGSRRAGGRTSGTGRIEEIAEICLLEPGSKIMKKIFKIFRRNGVFVDEPIAFFERTNTSPHYGMVLVQKSENDWKRDLIKLSRLRTNVLVWSMSDNRDEYDGLICPALDQLYVRQYAQCIWEIILYQIPTHECTLRHRCS